MLRDSARSSSGLCSRWPSFTGASCPLCVWPFSFWCGRLLYSPSSIPPLWLFVVPYVIWFLFVDDAYIVGKRRKEWLRRLPVFRYLSEYFPIRLVRTAELKPDRPYLFAYHPHGIIGFGAVTAFGSDACGFSAQYPGITPHVLTLESNFQMPLYREYLISLGFGAVSRKACEAMLRKGPGNAIVIVVGGAQESLNARPGELDLTLKRRKGFVRVAMRTGYVDWLTQCGPRAGARLWRERHLRPGRQPQRQLAVLAPAKDQALAWLYRADHHRPRPLAPRVWLDAIPAPDPRRGYVA